MAIMLQDTCCVRQIVRIAEQRLTSGFKVEKNESVGPGGGDVCLEEGQGGCFCLWVHLASAEPGVPRVCCRSMLRLRGASPGCFRRGCGDGCGWAGSYLPRSQGSRGRVGCCCPECRGS